ncbi:Dabb family protein [Paenibacillus camerounensis]|uniref:Dabb family protein n=1 Tax=Paenibacillus camerounensis TaxID=1243663 RepID=UPI0005A69BFF|nr:Dabb family protein [Paenibacillus camerounensis]
MDTGTIRHMALFTLKYPADSKEAEAFLKNGEKILSAIPAVRRFEALRQISSKCQYDFCFSMEFAGQTEYDAYNNDPAHKAFVTERWETEVVKFQEIDLRH